MNSRNVVTHASAVCKLCPTYGRHGSMYSKTGKNGQFYGCSNYGRYGCPYTENLESHEDKRVSVPRKQKSVLNKREHALNQRERAIDRREQALVSSIQKFLESIGLDESKPAPAPQAVPTTKPVVAQKPAKRLTMQEVAEIRVEGMKKDRMTKKVLAAKYDISHWTIKDIWNGKTHKNVRPLVWLDHETEAVSRISYEMAS